MAVLDRLPVDSKLAELGHRGLLLARAETAARSADPLGLPLARALRRASLGRLSAPERAWMDRIRDRRERVGGLTPQQLQRSRSEAEPADAESEYLANWALAWSLPLLWGRLLHCLVRELRPRTCIELGTGFGISAAFIASALELNGAGHLTSLDREDRVLRVAAEGLEQLELADRVRIVPGAISSSLAEALEAAGPVQWALIDAEHEEPAVLADFEGLLPGLDPGALVVFDDIHLSDGMTRAWERVTGHERAALTLDLHRLGLVSIGPR